MDVKKRSELFEQELEKLQEKYGMQLYAAQVLLQNGELVNLIKMREIKKYDNTKKGDIIDKKI